jgi:hypothetical protein
VTVICFPLSESLICPLISVLTFRCVIGLDCGGLG